MNAAGASFWPERATIHNSCPWCSKCSVTGSQHKLKHIRHYYHVDVISFDYFAYYKRLNDHKYGFEDVVAEEIN